MVYYASTTTTQKVWNSFSKKPYFSTNGFKPYTTNNFTCIW